MPSSLRSKLASALSSNLKTNLSPKLEGNVDTLISIHFSPNLRDILPSWGILLSAMSKLDITFILALRSGAILLLGFNFSLRIPSILNLIANVSS